MSLEERLSRLLFVVPYVAQRDGVPLAELAQKVGATPAQIEADLDLLSMVGQPPLTPDHLIDIYIEDDVVYAELDQSLSRPLQLTQEEARALVLGVRLVGQRQSLGDELERLLAKIVAVLNPVDQEMLRSLARNIEVAEDRGPDGGLEARLRAAIDAHREISLDYYSASSDREKRYRLEPLAIITHSGAEYLVALDCDAERHEKLFRLDRMGTLVMGERAFVPPTDLDLEKFRRERLYFGGASDFVAEVRFDAEVAALVAEQFAPADVRREEGGALVARVSTSSPAYLARWVLPFGRHAEVLSPPSLREHFARLCQEAAGVYR